MRPMRLTAAAALSLAACQCGSGATEKTYVCGTDDDCADGFVCVGLVCAPKGTATAGGAAAGGGTAGGASDAGGMGTAGGASAGGSTAGGASAGGTGTGAGGGVPPTALAFTTTPPTPLPEGTCFPAIVEARIGPTPQP